MLAIIPARGGSKGIPGKNIKPLCGKPLIAYTIEAAMAARSIDRVIVSTDDPKIAEVAKGYNAEVPFMRPSGLAQDDSPAIDGYLYTVERLNREFHEDIESFVVILPTNPLQTADDIDNAVQLFTEKNADSVIPCKKVQHPTEWVFHLNDDGTIERKIESEPQKMTNRQGIKAEYVPNGAVFVFQYSLLKEKRSYYFDKTYAYVMPQERSIDIDTELDLKFAEFIMSQRAVNA